MEVNTVVLPLGTYHELLGYKEAMELEKSIYVHYNHGHYARVISNDEAVQLIGETNAELKIGMDALLKKTRETRYEVEKLRNTAEEMAKIKRISLVQLIKWYFNGKKL